MHEAAGRRSGVMKIASTTMNRIAAVFRISSYYTNNAEGRLRGFYNLAMEHSIERGEDEQG
jgi:hypothetical protein